MPQRINSVNLRFERAKLPKNDFKLSNQSIIHILKSGSKTEEKIGFQTQHFPLFSIEFSEPSNVSHELKSKHGLANSHLPDEPIWANDIKDEVTDGDVWVPIGKDDHSLRIKVSSGDFHGYIDLQLSDENHRIEKDVKNYPLHDINGKEITGATLRLSYELGTHYQVEFKVGDVHLAAGTGGTDKYDLLSSLTKINPKMSIHFQIHGANNTTRFFTCYNENLLRRVISKLFSSDETIKTNMFVLKSIGDPIAMSIRVISLMDIETNWFLDKAVITIEKDDFHEEFPCYQWIKQGRLKTIAVVTGMLPGKVYKDASNPKLEILRRNELEVARSRYQWERQEGLPSHLFGTDYGCQDLMPREERFSASKTKDVISNGFDGILTTVHNFIKMFNGKELKTLDDHYHVYHHLGSIGLKAPEESLKHWNEDTYFGWTYLAGVNPYHFKLVKEVPKQFANSQFDDISGKPINLDEACLKGRLFYADYTGLAELNLHTEGAANPSFIQDGIKYSAPCTCLMYVDTDKKLRPIAIQLLPNGLIFTPKDTKWQWTYAKMAVRNADSQYHQNWDHWFNAHAMSEVYSISVNRAFSRVHPIYRLLINHMKYTININTSARKLLISSGGIGLTNISLGAHFSELLVINYKNMKLDKLDFPSRLESLGFHKTKDGVDKGALDEYPFGDDGALVWDAIYEFVGEYLRLYYHEDKDIIEDSEIGVWMKELYEEGHPVHKGAYPKVETIEALQKLVTTIIWTTSCHHSVVNFHQYKTMGFIPNYPAALFQPIPQTKEIIDEDYIVKSLPQMFALSLALFTLFTITQYTKAEEYLISNPYAELIGEDKARRVVENFKKKLEKIDKTIDDHNERRIKKGYFAYTLLKPSKVPNSVAI